jgi:hypothetical protein
MKKPELISLDEFKKLTLSEKAKYLNETAPAKFKPHILPAMYFYAIIIILSFVGGWLGIFGLAITFTVSYIIVDLFYNKWYCNKYHLEYSRQINLLFKNLQ